MPKGPVKREKRNNHRPPFLWVYRNNLAQLFLGLISVIEEYHEENRGGRGRVRARNAFRGVGLSDAVFEVVGTVGRETNGQGRGG